MNLGHRTWAENVNIPLNSLFVFQHISEDISIVLSLQTVDKN